MTEAKKVISFNEDLTGQVAVVTGATAGIGKEVARGLAQLGATVIIGARDPLKAAKTIAELSKDAKHPNAITTMTVDISNMSSVRKFAEEVAAKYSSIHILVNNAGAWFAERRETKEGHELTFATNALGPWLLTKLLAERLRSDQGARVVNVVSGASGYLDLSDLEWKKRPFNIFKAYAQSKQVLRMMTWKHASEFEGSHVTVNAVSPGFVKTNLNKGVKGFWPALFRFLGSIIGTSASEGADTPLWAAVSNEVEGKTGKYFEKRKEKDGKFGDAAAINQLDQLCESMTQPFHI